MPLSAGRPRVEKQIDKLSTTPTSFKTGSDTFYKRSLQFAEGTPQQRKAGGLAMGLNRDAPRTQQALAWEIWVLPCRTLNSISPE